MDSGAEYDLIFDALYYLFIVGFPIVLAASLAGTLAAALQTVTAIQEPALGYAVRLTAVVVVLYFFMPQIISGLLELAKAAFGG